ncbi:MAG: phosphatase [Actinomycetota bacterium]
MDLEDAHAERLPSIDDRWALRPHTREELVEGLIDGRVAGPVSHPLDNVRGNIRLLNDGDPDKQFGMNAVAGAFDDLRVLELMGELAGAMPDPIARSGQVFVDPETVLKACERMAVRLADACSRGETVVLATGHPAGLIHLYAEIGRRMAASGATIARPAEGHTWSDGDRDHPWQIRYLWGVAMLTDTDSPKHTHSGEPMRRMLEAMRPDLVLGDHGFAGAAIEAGVEAASVADVNDPALIVAKALGRTEHVVVMDDNVQPDAYWPCFRAIAALLP